MPDIQTLILGPLETNCYVIEGEGNRCLVIDPGCSSRTVLEYMEKQGLTVEAILLTHGHFDHVGAVKKLAEQTGCRVFLCKEDLSLPTAITSGALHYTDSYAEGDALTLAGLAFTVLHTPGHTPGSVCLCFENVMFSGDTLFAGSCGRTDLPGGDPNRMRSTLSRLAALDRNYTIYPGHGESTTLDEEKRYNPYLR